MSVVCGALQNIVLIEKRGLTMKIKYTIPFIVSLMLYVIYYVGRFVEKLDALKCWVCSERRGSNDDSGRIEVSKVRL